MKKIILLSLITAGLFTCDQNKKTDADDIVSKEDTNTSQTFETIEQSDNEGPDVKTNIIEHDVQGDELFKAILDTVRVKRLATKVLTSSEWIFRPFDNCKSTLTFKSNGDGTIYECEQEEDFELKYRIENNYLFVEQYEIPDHPQEKKIKTRDDKYVFNGQSLVMVGSTLYNTEGKSWTPDIKVVIKYEKR